MGRWSCEGQQQWDLTTSTNDFEGLSCGSGCGGVRHGGGSVVKEGESEKREGVAVGDF